MTPHLFILPGWGQDATHWSQFVAISEYPVVVIDLPGFGTEPLVSDAWGVPEYAAWVQEKIEFLPQEKNILLGHSFGGRIASLIAADRPAWLSSLILYGAPSLYRPGLKTQARIAAAKLLKGIVPEGLKPSDLKDAERKGLGAVFRRVVPFDQTDLLSRVSVPTLLMWGEKDTEVPLAIAEEMERQIPGSRLAVLPGIGHNAHLENPSLFYGTIKRFIEGL